MELWIRTQKKKTLLKVDMINVNSIRLISNGYVLGEYKTNERALEVLDEIQNMIKPILINTEYHSEIKQDTDKVSFDVVMTPIEDKITYIQPNVIVYEMPKE